MIIVRNAIKVKKVVRFFCTDFRHRTHQRRTTTTREVLFHFVLFCGSFCKCHSKNKTEKILLKEEWNV